MYSPKPAVISSGVAAEVIDVRGLTFSYPKARRPAVCGMDFTVGQGEIFGFLGPSGAGKSTTCFSWMSPPRGWTRSTPER
jgi:fluoroquinolone transport system ATP-binding protein